MTSNLSEVARNALDMSHHRGAVLPLQRLASNDDHGVLGLGQPGAVGVGTVRQLSQNLGCLADVVVVVGEVHLGADHRQVELVVDPALAQPGVEDRGIEPGVGADQKHEVGVLHTGDASVEKVVGPENSK